MKVKFSSTNVLLVALTVLIAWYALYEQKLKLNKATEENQSKKLIKFSKDDIQELEIALGPEAMYKLKRSDNEWLLVSPVEDSADSGVVNSLLTTLTAAEQERLIEENPANLAVFGLEKPSLILRVNKDVHTSQDVFVGNQTQVGSSVYVKTSNGTQVYKANRALLSSFQKNLFELRNKNLIDVKRPELKEVEITNHTGQILVNKSSDDKWQLSREGGSPVDSVEWGKVLNSLLDLKAVAVASEKPDVKTYKLDKPITRVLLASETNKPKHLVLFSKLNGKVYAKREDRPFIYEVNKEILTPLNQNASSLKDLHLASFNRFAVNRITFSRGSAQTLELKKEGPVWSFGESKMDRKLDPGKVEKFLTDLQDAKASAFSELKKNKGPSMMIEVFEKQNEKEVSVAKIEFFLQKEENAFGTSNHLKGAWAITRDVFKQLNLIQEDFLEPLPQKTEEKKS